jgi:hypothetical protein
VGDILIRKDNEPWREPEKSGYTDEAHLQSILQEHPWLIPSVKKNAHVCIEFQSGVGPSDVVAIDLENGLTLVECKLASNREVRREIIGQVLDYASRFWRMSIEDFNAQWISRTGRSLFSEEGDSIELAARLEESLSSGEFRIVLAVDEINDDLRRIVEFLNHVTVPSVAVIAVVYSRSQDGNIEILSRQIYGEELAEAKSQRSREARERWTEDQFLSWVDENESGISDKARTILDALVTEGFELAGGKAETPSLNFRLDVAGAGSKWPVILYTQKKGTSIELRFEDLKSWPEIAERFLKSVEAVPGVPIDGALVRSADYSKRPNLLLRDISHETIRALIKGISNTLKEPE